MVNRTSLFIMAIVGILIARSIILLFIRENLKLGDYFKKIIDPYKTLYKRVKESKKDGKIQHEKNED